MPRQGASNATDLLVGALSEQATVTIASVPETRHGKGDKRKGAALARDLSEHVIDHRFVLEAIAALQGGLYQSPPQRRPSGRPNRRQLRKDRREALEPVAVKEKVIAHRQQHVNVCVERDSSEQLRELLLNLGWTLGEQLLELIEDQQRFTLLATPASHHVDGDAWLLEINQPGDSLGIA